MVSQRPVVGCAPAQQWLLAVVVVDDWRTGLVEVLSSIFASAAQANFEPEEVLASEEVGDVVGPAPAQELVVAADSAAAESM